MKKICRFVIFISFTFLYAQETSQYTSVISKEDSLAINSLRNKMAANINPNPDSAFYYTRKIKEFVTQKNYGIGIADADYLIGTCWKRIQQNDSAINYFKSSLKLSKTLEYKSGKARAYNSLCRIYYLVGEMDASIKAGRSALNNADTKSPTNTLIFADTHIALATAYARQNNLEEAIKGLLIVDSIHRIQPLRPDVIAAAYQSLGGIYLGLKQYDEAEKYYIRANDEFVKLPANAASYYLNTTNINLGRVYYFKEDLVKADSLLILSHDFFSQIKDERTVGEISTYLGQVKMKNNQLADAEKFFKEGLDIHKNNNRYFEASQNALELAKLAIEKSDSKNVIKYLKDAETMNLAGKNSLISQEINELFAKNYSGMGDYQKAFFYNEKAGRIKDSLQEIQSSEKIKEIEAIYQTESRDREIALLTSQNELVEQQKKSQRNVLLGGLGLTGFAGLFFFFLYRNRQKTNNKLKELDNAKSTFFANISHEFRTPLTLIKGPLEDQLSSDLISKNDRKNLQIAKTNTIRLESLVEQLLALSKLESGNLKLKIQPGNLPQFIAAQAAAFLFSSQEKHINFMVVVKEDSETDWFDQDALEKVLFNLLGNAIKYTKEGGEIEITGERKNDSYIFSVANSGESITESDQEKIFDRFYQTTDQNTGTGIGLSLTKELVELHKGSIEVKSTKQGINQFTVTVPIKKESFSASEILSEELQIKDTNFVEHTEESTETNLIPSEDTPILLIVDDNREIRNYIGSIFESTYQIQTASNGKEGFETAINHIPDIVITDVTMPVEDGFSLTKKLKESEITSHIPIVLLTAKTEDSDKLEGIYSGADAYITKPFSSQLLKATLYNLLENRRKLQARFSQEVILLPKEIAVSSADELFLERLQKVIDTHLTSPDFNADSFSSEMAVSRMQLHRKLKAITGQSTSEFLKSQRLKLATHLLKTNKISISEVGYTVGFNDPSYFTRCFKQEYGCSPSEYISK